MRYLGIDYGTKRIGLAIADDEVKTAVVYGTVADVVEVAEVVKKEEVDTVVVGRPTKMSGEAHTMVRETEVFVQQLKDLASEVRIVLEDERLSSRYADSLGGGRAAAGRDEIAAVSILQGYLDKSQKTNSKFQTNPKFQ